MLSLYYCISNYEYFVITSSNGSYRLVVDILTEYIKLNKSAKLSCLLNITKAMTKSSALN